jgi:hypothetical protein
MKGFMDNLDLMLVGCSTGNGVGLVRKRQGESEGMQIKECRWLGVTG